jgi:hypothetical protein
LRVDSFGKRIRVLEQQATGTRTANAYKEADKALAEWAILETTITAQDARMLADDFRANPLPSNSPEMQTFANASGYTAEQCSAILSEALCMQFEVMHWQKTHPQNEGETN